MSGSTEVGAEVVALQERGLGQKGLRGGKRQDHQVFREVGNVEF